MARTDCSSSTSRIVSLVRFGAVIGLVNENCRVLKLSRRAVLPPHAFAKPHLAPSYLRDLPFVCPWPMRGRHIPAIEAGFSSGERLSERPGNCCVVATVVSRVRGLGLSPPTPIRR